MRRTPAVTPALIVGGGPAGAATATLLARAGLPHLLLERTRETGNALCGGFLSWRTLRSLETLGIEATALNPDPTRRVRLFAGKRIVEAPLPRPAVSVSRHRLDTVMLARAIAAGAAVERGVAVRGVDGLVARTADGATIAADALFLASGKHDVRGLARPEEARGRDPTMGLRLRLGPAPGLTALVGDAVELHLVDRGYAGLAIQEDGSANLCMAIHLSRLTAAGSPERLLAALAVEAPALADRLAYAAPSPVIDAVANVPYGWRVRHGEAGLFRLGDQAGVIPSLAGEGMGIAIASGIAAASAYRTGGAASAAAWQRSFARRIARPIGVASLVRVLGEGRFAPVIGFAPRGLVDLVARTTRVG
ncbi:NAD(P)/FAD-dependent oxidoreductase [uncultured Sphingomonas sp.]|uniref:NAD(P)/FAD-dependent oxidoreductase n=1 Tax=uncultured Sphingomonas sp. TaxID=158754 RepID=UPI0035CA5596